MEIIIIICLIGVILAVVLATLLILMKLSSINNAPQNPSNDILIMNQRLDASNRIAFELNSKLSTLEEANKRIFEVGKDIASLQEILKAPKIRGTLGELFLGDLLSQMLPRNRFALQYQFKTGSIVDAAIIFPNGLIVPVDSKFPLENFKRTIIPDLSDEEKLRHRKLFISDVKRHIDAISEKYIRTDEKTSDFALMYIPAENIYYETIVRDDSQLFEYAFTKKVLPVSPNTLNIYLQTIIIGLRGLQVEEKAKEILNDLINLRNNYKNLQAHFEILGKHLNNARQQYDETDRDLNRIGDKLSNIETKD